MNVRWWWRTTVDLWRWGALRVPLENDGCTVALVNDGRLVAVASDGGVVAVGVVVENDGGGCRWRATAV